MNILSVIFFIIIPITYLFKTNTFSFGHSEMPQLIILGFYLFTIIIIIFQGQKIFKKKIASILLFIILPVSSLIIITTTTAKWYDIYENAQEKAVVYIYNESSSEQVQFVNWKVKEYDETLIDKFFAFFLSKNPNNSRKMVITKNRTGKLNIRSGVYEFQIETENVNTKKKYLVDLNTTDIKVNENEEIFLCFGGKTFFPFIPNEQERKRISASTWNQDIALPDNSPASKKVEKKR